MDENKLGERSENNLKGVHPKLVKVIREAIKKSSIDFTIVEGVRTAEQQREYYSWGRTKENPNTGKMTKVTYADGVVRKSNHQVKADGYGYAVDLYPFFDNKVQVNHKDTLVKLKEIANHIKATAERLGVKIIWGGDWTRPYDPPHFELKQ